MAENNLMENAPTESVPPEITRSAVPDDKIMEMPDEKADNKRTVLRTFRLLKSENAALKEHIHYAYLSGQIPRPSFTKYIMFCLNAGHEKLSQIYHKK